MLVLKREVGRRIMIGHNIEIQVISIGPGWCRIGIDAPRDVPVHREEVAERLKRGEPPRYGKSAGARRGPT